MKLKRRKLDCPPPFLPMADLAFNLVLFFIILARTQDDSHLQWTPAEAPGTARVEGARASVTVDADNKVYLNGRQVGVRDLADGIGVALGTAPANERVVLLKIHRDTLAATFEPIMEAVSQAGGEVVHVVQEERK